MTKEDKYKLTLYIDLTYFLMKALLNNNPDRIKLTGHILDTWSSRNVKIMKQTFDKEVKINAKRIECVGLGLDEIRIMLSTQELILNSVREDLVKMLKKEIIDSFDLEVKSK